MSRYRFVAGFAFSIGTIWVGAYLYSLLHTSHWAGFPLLLTTMIVAVVGGGLIASGGKA